MSALIVPLHTVRHALAQSARLGIDESREVVIRRVLDDLRDFRHPALSRIRPLSELQRIGIPPREVAHA